MFICVLETVQNIFSSLLLSLEYQCIALIFSTAFILTKPNCILIVIYVQSSTEAHFYNLE